MKITITSLTIAAFLMGCSESSSTVEEKSGEVTSAISAGVVSEKELKEAAEMERAQLEQETANSTTLKFDRLKHDFGNVQPDSDNTTEFKLTNTGDKPLIVSDVSASCGCTMPQKPEGPIAPGESDVIAVTFHPKPGQVNEIKKSITVTANTIEKIHLLEIRAFVLE